MKSRELTKLMQSEFDSGETLQAIYEKHQSDSIKERKLAYMVATLKDKDLIKKHKMANNILIGIMVFITMISAFLGYTIGLEATPNSAIYWSAIAIIPMIFLYGFIKVNYQAYLIYIILSITRFPETLTDFGADPVAGIVGLVITISLISHVLYLKLKLFPYMAFFSPKKNSDNQYLVAENNQ